METKPYEVNVGAVLAHDGREHTSGAVVQLPPHVAFEVRHLVTPLDPVTKKRVPWGPADQVSLEAELAAARPHERISLVEAAIAQHRVDGAHLQRLLEAAQRDAADAAKRAAAAKAPPAPPPAPGKTTSPKDGK